MIDLAVQVELGESFVEGERVADVLIGGVSVFSKLVYDNEKTPAETNIVLMFTHRLRRLLEESA